MRNHNIICTPNKMQWNIQHCPREHCAINYRILHSLCLTQFELCVCVCLNQRQIFNCTLHIKCNYIHDGPQRWGYNDDKIEQKHAIPFELIWLVCAYFFSFLFVFFTLFYFALNFILNGRILSFHTIKQFSIWIWIELKSFCCCFF